MYWQSSEQRLEREFEKLVSEYKMAGTELEMVVVILPFKGGQVYDAVKKLGDLKYKVPTQCCLKRNIFKPGGEVNHQVLSNLCLKLNSKLGGINHVLAPQSRPVLLNRPVMIMGADVTHPAPGQKVGGRLNIIEYHCLLVKGTETKYCCHSSLSGSQGLQVRGADQGAG